MLFMISSRKQCNLLLLLSLVVGSTAKLRFSTTFIMNNVNTEDEDKKDLEYDDLSTRLQMYDEIFNSNPQSVKNIQKHVRLHQDCKDTAASIVPISDHRDSGYILASCQTIHYRAKSPALDYPISDDLIVGVHSASSAKTTRDIIRSELPNLTSNVFFIVSGPWENIEQEYNDFNDMIWIDDAADTAESTLKSYAYLGIMYERIRPSNPHINYFLKTNDDDVIANMKKLTKSLVSDTNEDEPSIDYWGNTCHDESEPDRVGASDSFMSYKTYPFAHYPSYCSGDGYGVSSKLLDCAVGDGHVAKVRLLPLEDVAVGMLAERCDVEYTRWPVADEEAMMKKKNMRGNLAVSGR